MSDSNQQQFSLQRIYIKDISFETPQGVEVFRQQWKPAIKLDMNATNKKIDEDNYEVVLTLTVTATLNDKPAFLAEVHQGGLFVCQGMDDKQIHQVLGSVCPNILFPYARETIDNLALKGSFPPLMLAPVNFDALYQQALARAKTEADAQTAH
jgi:preprotein translocase subunit SecB